ncbi:MAG: ABC transporter ATP-binding protein, partial [Rhodospirillaceae bacterium]|nr:ABC transporter ATP-binding protein [Rhodospirillaceae bacterium]
EELCDQIAIINHGRVVVNDKTENLLNHLDNKAVTFVLSAPLTAVPEALVRFNATLAKPNELNINYRPSSAAMGEIIEAVRGAGLGIADMRTDEVDLEDIFLQLTRAAPAA